MISAEHTELNHRSEEDTIKKEGGTNWELREIATWVKWHINTIVDGSEIIDHLPSQEFWRRVDGVINDYLKNITDEQYVLDLLKSAYPEKPDIYEKLVNWWEK